MSTDAVKQIDEAREALRETVQRLARVADGLRGEPELPPEPSPGAAVLSSAGRVWQRDRLTDDRNSERAKWHAAHWTPLTWAELNERHGPLVPLVRADRTVVLPSEFDDPVFVDLADGSRLGGWIGRNGQWAVELVEPRVSEASAKWVVASIPLADAERWLLETLALVRSKGGGS